MLISGITPLHDAASNGHLDVIQLLIQKGAITSLKTDFGQTPLQILQKWRSGKILSKDEEATYKSIFNKCTNSADRSMSDVLNRSKSKTPVKTPRNTTPPSTSKMNSHIRELHSPIIKRRNVINDDSDDDIGVDHPHNRNQVAFPSESSDTNDSSDEITSKTTSSGVNEYRSAISALRNRNIIDLPDVDVKKTKQKPALLAPDEVDDDWLDDDLGVNKSKRMKFSHDPLTLVSTRPPPDSIKTTIENINKYNEPLVENKTNSNRRNNSRPKDVIDLTDYIDNNSRIENISPKKRLSDGFDISKEFNDSRSRDSRLNIKRRCKTQSTLFKAGFQRRRNSSSNSGSESESKICNWAGASTSFSRKSSNESFGGTNYIQNDGFNILQNINNGLNAIKPINVVQQVKNGQTMTQIMPPAAVKVHVQDKVLLISLKLQSINKLTINWLAEEVKNRYYK